MKWVIAIGGYGSFFFDGTEVEAEEMRRHKANWEQGVGRKRLADDIETESLQINHCHNHPNYGRKGNFNCACKSCKTSASAQNREG